MVSDELIKLKVKELILLLVNSDRGDEMIAILQDLFNEEAYSFRNIINNHLFENLTLEELAILTNKSVSSFKRTFKEVFEEAPARYIKRKRLQKAAELLKTTDKRIREICFECGFRDGAHFTRSFTQQFGSAPAAYRESD